LFDDFQIQTDRIKKEIVNTAAATPSPGDTDSPSLEDGKTSANASQLLKTGDFFVTTHSNLNIDVVFHMALEKKNSTRACSSDRERPFSDLVIFFQIPRRPQRCYLVLRTF
jgi:hypothetical protein